MSPESHHLTTNSSSIQGSPEGIRGRDNEFPPPPFELPESIVSRKASQSAMSEAVAMSKSPGLIRRISNRASQFTNRRRQSSTTAMSRDHSTGPVIMRRRSDSTSTAPEGRGALFSDSDSDINGDYLREEPLEPSSGVDGGRDYPSTTASIGSSLLVSSSPGLGPVIPSILRQGTILTKVSKKKKKLWTFVLEHEAAKVSWDKNRPYKSFYIDDIKDIRVGADARNYRQEFGVPSADESKFFSIVYAVPDKSKGRGQQKVMHLVAGDEQTFDLWTTTLDAISRHRKDLIMSLSSFRDQALENWWRNEMNKVFHDTPHSEDEETIDRAGVERLCHSIHIHGSLANLHAKFDKAVVSRTGHLNFAEFQHFIKLLKRRDDVGPIYRELAADVHRGLTSHEFLGFLSDIQEEDVSADPAHWEGVFNKYSRHLKTREPTPADAPDDEPRMNEAALSRYFISSFNAPLRAAPTRYVLDRPMNEYFISSSHNTYLLGRQVAGQSSVEAYISALAQGCRCVEVDCWNGNDGQPVVMHGRTLTSQVSFRDVMSTISKYAFAKSPYPLWISLEVHCNPAQQAWMAAIIKETCGSKLVTGPLDGLPTEQLPSPSQLMNRILIKVKKPRLSEDAAMVDQPNGRTRGSSLSSPYIRPQQLDSSTISAGLLPPSPYPGRSTRLMSRAQLRYNGSEGQESLSSSTSDSESGTDEVRRPMESSRKNRTSNIVKALGELGVYSAGLKFQGFDSAASKAYNHVFSFSEKTFDGNSKTPEEMRAVTRHNMRYMMRVYPSAWRVASTNFDPLRYWRRGVQMTALNWQTYDLGMQLNDAMFAGGQDQSGYVLKPIDLREIKMIKNVPTEAGDGHTKRERKTINFSIDVISAQQLMRPSPKALAPTRSVDPYVEVEVYHGDDKGKESTSGLGNPHRRRTHIVQENGFNPIFDKKFNFSLTTKYPELVFVKWTVRCSSDGHSQNDKAPVLATYTAKLSGLNQGYRTLPLFDGNGDRFLFSTLFCRVKIEALTSTYINGPESAHERESRFRTIRQTVFNRTPLSPKPSIDSGSP
ncbi:putative 1-phosphatidylinositol-4,5-bisphosphate phosphodiesterase 1 [Amylocarpus encephaloides]|uniref:Phosphoinositide phospholipase C n=1 Tax=Amylocarpus encephaloides TaxID=45428 RepID=A0A9P7YHZ2_9HELO|nr:putative 1-phosphatidylinositol-4,5-bisphosphate phosphodiesterase 1 [Amylocarpus encephaloides]